MRIWFRPGAAGAALGLAVLTMTTACSDLALNDPGAAGTSPSSTSSSEASDPSPTERSTTSSPGSSADTSPASVVDWTRVAAEAADSVVSISVAGPSGSGQGSGVIIDTKGHVLTNNHVVAPAVDAGQVQVSLSDARVVSAEVVGNDPDTDLAVLELTDPPGDLSALPFGDSEALEVGQPVLALGNPLGLSNTVTLGIVSALDRPVTTDASTSTGGQAAQVVTNAIQTDAAVNPGNSGGALIDGDGRLVGINSSIATLGASLGGQGGSIGLGFAIPSSQAEWVAGALIATGTVEHALLGVTLEDAVVSVAGVEREAAGITGVEQGSAAAEAGLRAGEAVAEVDGEIVAGADSLRAQVRERPPGTQVDLLVVGRGGDAREVTVEFGTSTS